MSISAVARFPNHLDTFWVAGDGRVNSHWWHDGLPWSDYFSVGGFFPPGAQVSSLARVPDHLDLFVTGNDGRVYTSWWHQGGEWSGWRDNWRSIGGFFPRGAPLSAVARFPNHIDLFVTGHDGRVYTSWWHEGQEWSGIRDNWRSIGGFFPAGAPVSSVARVPQHLDLFVTGHDGRVYTSWWHEGSDWSGIRDNWRSIGGFFPPGAPVSVVSRYPNHLDLFVTGYDGRVYTSWWHEGQEWSGIHNNWRSIGGFFPRAAPVAALARVRDHLDLFITGNDGRVYTSWWHQGSDWSGIRDNWRSIGGFFPRGERVAAVARLQNHLDVFIIGNDGRPYTSWWHEGSDWSGIRDNWLRLPPTAQLNFVMQAQTQSNWCWAATSVSVARYYNAGTTWTQCAVANGELGRTDCCTTGAAGPCNQANTLNTALTRVGHLNRMTSGPITREQIRAELAAGRPVCARTAWAGGGAHFVAITGFFGGDIFEIDDPISGVQNVDYDVFLTSYRGSGSWTHSYFTN